SKRDWSSDVCSSDLRGTGIPKLLEFQQLCSGYGSYRFLELSGKQCADHGDCYCPGSNHPFSGRICYRQKHGTQQSLQLHLSLHCKWYVRTFCNPDDACCKADGTDGTGKQSGRYFVVYGILYAYEPAAVLRLSEKYPSGS